MCLIVSSLLLVCNRFKGFDYLCCRGTCHLKIPRGAESTQTCKFKWFLVRTEKRRKRVECCITRSFCEPIFSSAFHEHREEMQAIALRITLRFMRVVGDISCCWSTLGATTTNVTARLARSAPHCQLYTHRQKKWQLPIARSVVRLNNILGLKQSMTSIASACNVAGNVAGKWCPNY